ncbi:unnamed protein product [Anisakis simplex]|uniref:Secreted protein n=1 Tax=Anisakis simplex TaxID=6269 RepID=A0A0M3J7H5_ANISI|nr:unnamed protein product [Anisakis simplex]
MIVFYVTFVCLVVLLDGLIPRIKELCFTVNEKSDSFAADEVRLMPHNLPPMQIAQQTPFSPVPPTSFVPTSPIEQ